MTLTSFFVFWAINPFFLAAPVAKYTLTELKEKPPTEVKDDFKKLLGDHGVRVTDKKNKPMVDIWFRKEITKIKKPRSEDGATLTSDIAAGTFLGVIRYHKKRRDFRDKSLKAGIYTMRYGIQPTDGDHLGVSDTRDFALLCPAEKDTRIDPIAYKDLVKLSTQASGTSHPNILYMISTKDRKKSGKLPALIHDEEMELRFVDFQVNFEKEKDKGIRLGLIVVGKAPE